MSDFAALSRFDADLPEPVVIPASINGVDLPLNSPLRVLYEQAIASEDPSWTPEQRLAGLRVKVEAAKALAGFVHPKLSQVEHRGSMTLTHEQALKQLEGD